MQVAAFSLVQWAPELVDTLEGIRWEEQLEKEAKRSGFFSLLLVWVPGENRRP